MNFNLSRPNLSKFDDCDEHSQASANLGFEKRGWLNLVPHFKWQSAVEGTAGDRFGRRAKSSNWSDYRPIESRLPDRPPVSTWPDPIWGRKSAACWKSLERRVRSRLISASVAERWLDQRVMGL